MSEKRVSYPYHMPVTLTAKVGSIVRHVEEALSSDGHRYDFDACSALLKDPEVREWMDALDAHCLLPLLRHRPEKG